MSWDQGRGVVTLKRMPFNRLAAMHRLLPSLCTRQLRISGLGWAAQGREIVGIVTAGRAGWEGRAVTQPFHHCAYMFALY